MFRIFSRFNTVLLLLAALAILTPDTSSAQTEWIKDDQMKFKIQVPKNYQKSRFVEGTDVIHAFLSPDQNVAVRIRSIKVNSSNTIEQIVAVFEQNIIKGAQKLLEDKFTLNKIPGKIYGYKWKFNNIPVGLALFCTIKNEIAYVVWSLVPEQMFKQRTPETDAIINTFTLIDSKSKTKVSDKTSPGKAKKIESKEKPEKAGKVKTQNKNSQFFDLVSDDAKITHRVPAGFELSEKEEGQSIWQNNTGVKLVIQTITQKGDFKDYIKGLIAEIKENGATVTNNVFTVENGLPVANYTYQYGDSFFAYGATVGNNVYYLAGFVGNIKDKALLSAYSEETNMSFKKSK